MSDEINFQILLEKKYHSPQVLFHLGAVCLEKGHYQLALNLFLKLLKTDPNEHSVYKLLARTYERLGKSDLAYHYYLKLWKLVPTADLALEMGYFLKSQFKSIQALDYFQQAFQLEKNRTLDVQKCKHSILISTLPKSGSAYIYNGLINGILLDLKYHEVAISSRVFFPQDIIQPYNFQQFMREPSVANEHLPALPDNIQYLNQYLGRWVVHVRDPRQSLLSWFYFLDGQEHNKMNQHYLHPSYYLENKEEQLNWQIQHQLSFFVDWLSGWMMFFKHSENSSHVLLTYYRELRFEPERFFARILEHFELNHSYFTFPESPKVGQFHYRKGEIDEWREVFSPLQQVMINQLVPEELLDFYGWER